MLKRIININSLLFLTVWLVLFMGACKKDPILDEIDHFAGSYQVDSIRYVSGNTNVLYENLGEIVLRMHPETDTISAFGETVVIEPGESENTFLFTPGLYQFHFVKRFAPSYYCLGNEGDLFAAYWFPDLNQLRLTFWASCGNGTYRSVVTVKSLGGNRFRWTYVEAADLGASATLSALKLKEVIYLTKK